LIFHFAQIERPATIVWDEVWYVGDARSIISGTGELRPEHPPLAKLFIVAGDYLFSGFKTPEHRSGAMNTGIVNSSSSSTTFAVTNASKFTIGMALRMDNGTDDGHQASTLRAIILPSTGAQAGRQQPSMPSWKRFTSLPIRLSTGASSR
jgi:hypothetical protein